MGYLWYFKCFGNKKNHTWHFPCEFRLKSEHINTGDYNRLLPGSIKMFIFGKNTKSRPNRFRYCNLPQTNRRHICYTDKIRNALAEGKIKKKIKNKQIFCESKWVKSNRIQNMCMSKCVRAKKRKKNHHQLSNVYLIGHALCRSYFVCV